MRHYKKGRKLGTDISHTKAMKRSLVKSLFLNDRIKTIESRAKEIRPDVDKIITWAKKGDLHSRRLAIAALGNDSDLVAEIFEKAKQGMWGDRQGGYTRILKLGFRKGDNAPMVIMELIAEAAPKKKADKAEKAEKPAKAEKAEEVVEETAEDATEEVIDVEPVEAESVAEAAEEVAEEPAAEEAPAEAEAEAEAKATEEKPAE